MSLGDRCVARHSQVLLNNVCFTRRWIIQEFCLARTVILIGAGFEWSIHELIKTSKSEDRAAKLVTERENIAREDLTNASTLDELLRDHTDAECADYQDVVYALIG